MRTAPSETGGVLTDPDGTKFDLTALVAIPTYNAAGDVIVVCKGTKRKPAADDGYVPCNVPNIAAAFAEIVKQLGGVEGLEMKVAGPFEIPLGAKSVPADPCCQDPEKQAMRDMAHLAPEQLGPVPPAKPKPRRKAAAKKPARRRR